jgi:hypothetical protein
VKLPREALERARRGHGNDDGDVNRIKHYPSRWLCPSHSVAKGANEPNDSACVAGAIGSATVRCSDTLAGGRYEPSKLVTEYSGKMGDTLPSGLPVRGASNGLAGDEVEEPRQSRKSLNLPNRRLDAAAPRPANAR